MQIVIDKVTVVQTTKFSPPHWMKLALSGQKIDAIKELRSVAGYNAEGPVLALSQAKRMVESVTDGITKEYV